MTKFTKERWHSGTEQSPAYVQMNNEHGPQGGFLIRRLDCSDHKIANLISAAPDMYDALEYCLDSLGCEFALPKDCISYIDAALAKARGES